MSTQAQSQAGGVGALLKQSREQRGLTTADVARELRLKVSLIEQIEAEQWDPTVSATFIRGYLRAYAKLMKLPEHEILANFELQAAYLRHQTKPMHSFSNKASLDAVDNRFMLASYLLIVLLIGLFLVWFWQTHLLDSEPVTALPELPATMSSSEVATTAVEDTTTLSSAELLKLATPATELTTAEQQNAASGTAEPAASDTQVPPASDNHAQIAVTAADTPANVPATTTAEPQQVVIKPQAQAATAPVAADNSTPAADAAVSAGNTILTLQFNAECWLEVTDATGKRLAYGTRQAGQTERLSGTAPLKVTLGNAAAATVQFNDVAVDLSGYAAGRVARLTLGGQP